MSRRTALSALLVALLAALAGPAASPASADTVVDAGIAFLAAQQRADGGFGASEPGFPGFETPDAVLAIASAAQTGPAWSEAEARAAVQAVQNGGRSGLSYLDDYADGVYGPFGSGPAARLVIVAERLGLDPTAFDPDGDGATDLVAAMQSGLQPDGSFGAFNTTLTTIVAYRAAGLTLPAATVPYVEGAQQPNGSWDFVGDPAGSEADPDTTGLAITALVAAGRGWDSPVVQQALGFLAGAQNGDGTWSDAFGGGGNPSSTANAMLGISAAGFDPAARCWRDVAGGAPDDPFASPDDALRATQAADGHLESPYDEWGLNTLGTSQGLVALLRNALPVVRAEAPPCPEPVPTTTTGPTTTSTVVAATSTSSTTSTPVTVAAGGSTTSTTRAASWRGAELPRTGGGALASVGVLLLVAGVAAIAFAASPRRRATR